MLENVALQWNTSDKFRPIEGRYLIEPGTCAGCGRPPNYPEEPFISLMLELEFYGVVYLCMDCSKAIADAVGWIGPDGFYQYQRANSLLMARNSNLTKQVEYLKELLNVRIISGGPSKSDSNEFVNLSLFEVESDSVIINQDFNGSESESSESGS